VNFLQVKSWGGEHKGLEGHKPVPGTSSSGEREGHDQGHLKMAGPSRAE